jgi:hypothetical protein
MITSPSAAPAAPTAPVATLPYEIRWSEPKLLGRSADHALSVDRSNDASGYPAVRATQHKMFDSPTARLDGAQVASISDARRAVDELRVAWDAVAATQLPASGSSSLPQRGMMTFGVDAGGYVSLPLKSDDPVVSAFTGAVLDLAAVVRANAREI